MKILRVRRGFSTNCSGANEYFPPSQALAPPTNEDSPWNPNPEAKVVFRWVTFMPDGAPPPMLREAMRKSAGDASADGGDGDLDGAAERAALSKARASQGDRDGGGPARANDDDAGAPAAPSATRGSHGFGLILFVVVLVMLATYGVERLTRRLRRSIGKGRRDDSER